MTDIDRTTLALERIGDMLEQLVRMQERAMKRSVSARKGAAKRRLKTPEKPEHIPTDIDRAYAQRALRRAGRG